MTSRKKEEETSYLERFRSNLKDFPLGEVFPDERPDFLVKGPTRAVGIELTRLCRPEPPNKRPMQEQESLQERCLATLKEIWTSQPHTILHVSVTFDDRYPLSKHGIPELAQKLYRLILQRRPKQNQPVIIQNEEYDDTSIPREVHCIHILRYDGSRCTFVPCRNAWVTRPNICDFQNVLDKKESIVLPSREKCNELWLVIVLTDTKPSGAYDIPTQALKDTCYTSGFDRVFLLYCFAPDVVELRVTPVQR